MAVTSVPSMTTRPESGASNPAIRRSKVVLPQPDGPSNAKNSPRSTESDTRSTAATVPNHFSASMMSSSAIRSAAGFAPAPQASAEALIGTRCRQVDIEQAAHRIRRVDAGVVAYLLFDQGRRGEIRVWIRHRVANRGDHLGPQHVIDKAQRVLGVRRIGGDAEHVNRHLRPLARHPEGDLDPALGLCGAVAGLGRSEGQTAEPT